MRSLFLLVLGAIAVSGAAVPRTSQRIVGGSATTIDRYPFGAVVLFLSNGGFFRQHCGGSIINENAVLTAAHCLHRRRNDQFRIRVGSTQASSGGSVHAVNRLISHASFNHNTQDNDLAIMRTTTQINFLPGLVAAGTFAGSNYNVPDGASVWAIGWGAGRPNGPGSEQLRHVEIWTVNQAVCRARYQNIRMTVTDNMLCSGWLDVGGRDQCTGDSGGPLLHDNVVIGVSSWGQGCASAEYPGVNVRVSRYIDWIRTNA
ncbi:trypsin, alkaline A-like [Plutella xylostella]|uniref:trypsin, alkaline A-like n=1 Tax=Plutella xylostella TaxID=51655 RepID=UPI0018D0A1BF|nr:trypsin, alkaline A-like [Plutella xylostella]